MQWLPITCASFFYSVSATVYADCSAESAEDIIQEEELRELLRAVDLDYLLERHGMHTILDWGRILSLGVPACTIAASLRARWAS